MYGIPDSMNLEFIYSAHKKSVDGRQLTFCLDCMLATKMTVTTSPNGVITIPMSSMALNHVPITIV